MNYFTLFGLPSAYSQCPTQIKARYHQLQRKIHPDNFVGSTPQEKRLAIEYAALVNSAYQTLRDPFKRAVYLLKQEGVDVENETDTHMPLDFLAEQMELREQFAVASATELGHMKVKIEQGLAEQEKKLGEYFEQSDLTQARLILRKMQFYIRLIED